MTRLSGQTNCDSFRFSDDPFFLKLCPRIELDPGSDTLVKGMYLPLRYWRLLENDPRIVGPRDGRRITFTNARRYLTNTEFTQIVQNAWVGTTPNQSSYLAPLIERIVQEGRAAVLVINSQRENENII